CQEVDLVSAMEKHLRPQDHCIQTELKDIYFVSVISLIKLIERHQTELKDNKHA
ncbi:hypothetical protein ACJX0J_005880, partial [Zea mays]